MQENQPIVNQSISNPINQKPNNFLIIFLSILLIISVVIAGFFAFQTQKLVKELTLLKSQPTPTTTPEPVVSPELTFEQDKTLDPTANWKTYKNTEYTFKYPIQWDTFVLCEKTENPILMIAPQGNFDEIKKGATCGFGTGKYLTLTIMTRSFENIIKSSDYLSVTNTSIKIDDKDATRYDSVAIKDLGPMQKGDRETLVAIKNGGGYLEILLLDQKYVNVFDQILSTFKFINLTP